MRKKQLAQQLAKESRITAGAAADQVDRVVNDILQRMRKGESAALPGLGTFHPGAGDSFQFEPGSRLSSREEGAAMKAGDAAIRRRIARIVRDALARGHSVEIDGLGEFVPDRAAGVRFVAQTKPRIFIAYVEEDLARARKLYRAFERYGLRPWMDKLKLMPGQNWPRAIENAIQTSDFFVACFSQRAAGKRGTFHSELRFALACAERVPLDEIFFIPIRLDGCSVPGRIARSYQYVDLFPDWDAGLGRVLEVIERQLRKRRRGLRLVS